MNIMTHVLAAISRLRQRRPAVPSADHEAGRSAGRAWALFWRDPIELECIAQLASGEIEVSADGDAGEWLAMEMGESMGFDHRHRDFLYRVRSVLFPDPDEVYSPAFVAGYLKAAADVWRALKAEGSHSSSRTRTEKQ